MPFTVSDESAADVFVTNLLVAVFSSISVRPAQTTPLGLWCRRGDRDLDERGSHRSEVIGVRLDSVGRLLGAMVSVAARSVQFLPSAEIWIFVLPASGNLTALLSRKKYMTIWPSCCSSRTRR